MNNYNSQYQSNLFDKDSTANINLNLDDYTLSDIFEILNIKVDDVNNFNDKLDEINSKILSLRNKFEKMNNKTMMNFFDNMKLVFNKRQKNESENEKTVINKDLNVLDTEGLYDSNVDNLRKQKIYNVNQIVRKTVSHTINVDSRFRNNRTETTSNDFSIKLPSKINNVIEMKICDIEFPITYYPIASEYYTDYFWIKQSLADVETYYYVKYADSIYSKTRFVSRFNETATEYGLNAKMILDIDTTYGINEGTGKLKIFHVNNLNLSDDVFSNEVLTFNFNSPPYEGSIDDEVLFTEISESTAKSYYDTEHSVLIQDKLGWMMGLRDDYFSIGETNEYEESYTADSIMDLSGPRYFYICINDYNGNMNNTYYSSSKYEVLKQNIMGRIKISGSFFDVMKPDSDGFTSNPRYYFGPINLEKISVKIYDDHNRLLNLNNSDLSFTIQVKSVYQSKNEII